MTSRRATLVKSPLPVFSKAAWVDQLFESIAERRKSSSSRRRILIAAFAWLAKNVITTDSCSSRIFVEGRVVVNSSARAERAAFGNDNVALMGPHGTRTLAAAIG